MDEDVKKLGRLASRWLKDKVGSIAGDPMENRRREEEAARTETELKRAAADQAEREVLRAVLPKSWNDRIEAARPENRAARAAERHREELESGDHAHLEATLNGGVRGEIDAVVAVNVTDMSEDSDVGFWRVELEAPDPIPVGGTDFRRLVFLVPVEAVNQACDLAEWTSSHEDSYDPLDFELQLGDTTEPQQWTASFGPAPVQVIGSDVVVSLPTEDPGSRKVQFDATIACPSGSFGEG